MIKSKWMPEFEPAERYNTHEEEQEAWYTKYPSNNMCWADIVIECYGFEYWVKLRVISSHRKFLKLLEDSWYINSQCGTRRDR